jgi:hypothetical protein
VGQQPLGGTQQRRRRLDTVRQGGDAGSTGVVLLQRGGEDGKPVACPDAVHVPAVALDQLLDDGLCSKARDGSNGRVAVFRCSGDPYAEGNVDRLPRGARLHDRRKWQVGGQRLPGPHDVAQRMIHLGGAAGVAEERFVAQRGVLALVGADANRAAKIGCVVGQYVGDVLRHREHRVDIKRTGRLGNPRAKVFGPVDRRRIPQRPRAPEATPTRQQTLDMRADDAVATARQRAHDPRPRLGVGHQDQHRGRTTRRGRGRLHTNDFKAFRNTDVTGDRSGTASPDEGLTVRPRLGRQAPR